MFKSNYTIVGIINAKSDDADTARNPLNVVCFVKLCLFFLFFIDSLLCASSTISFIQFKFVLISLRLKLKSLNTQSSSVLTVLSVVRLLMKTSVVLPCNTAPFHFAHPSNITYNIFAWLVSLCKQVVIKVQLSTIKNKT